MPRLSPQLLVQTSYALAMSYHGTPTADHVPVAYSGSESLDALATTGRVDVALIQHCGYWSHYDARSQSSTWPLPNGMSAHELALYGMSNGVLHEKAQAGDIFLQYSCMTKEYVHAGMVINVERHEQPDDGPSYFELYTVEGDTDEFGNLGRGNTMKVRRRLWPSRGDRYLRWADLNNLDTRISRAFPQTRGA